MLRPFAAVLVFIFCTFGLSEVQAQVNLPPADLEAVRNYLRLANELPRLSLDDQEFETATSAVIDTPARPMVPSRARIPAVKAEAEPGEPPFMIYFPQGGRAIRNQGESVGASIVTYRNLGPVFIFEDWTSVTNAKVNFQSQTVTRTDIQAYARVNLPKYTFQTFPQGWYMYRVAFLADDPVNRKIIGEGTHLILIDGYGYEEKQKGIRFPFRLFGAFANQNFQTGGVGSITVLGSWLSEADERAAGIKQYLVVPGIGTMRTPNGGTFATLQVNGNLDGWQDVVYVLTDGYGRVHSWTMPQAVLMEPALRVQ